MSPLFIKNNEIPNDEDYKNCKIVFDVAKHNLVDGNNNFFMGEIGRLQQKEKKEKRSSTLSKLN